MSQTMELVELTKAELEIMQVLWGLERGFVNDIIEKLPEPKPAYNTVSTVVRILEKKEFVDHKPYGRSHQYHPVVTKERYTQRFMKGVMDTFFDNSISQMVSFLAEKDKISASELEQILEILNKNR